MTDKTSPTVVPFPTQRDHAPAVDELIVLLYRVATGDLTLEHWLQKLGESTGIGAIAVEELDQDGSVRDHSSYPNHPAANGNTTVFALEISDHARQYQLVVAAPLPPEASAIVRPLTVHLARVLSLQETLHLQRVRIADVAKTLAERMVVGVIVFQVSTRQITHINALAEKLCASSDRLQLSNDQLKLKSSRLDAELDKLLAQDVAAATGRQLKVTGSDLLIACDRLERQTQSSDPASLMDYAVLYVFHSRDLPTMRAQALEQNFSLTPREARVTAGVCSGRSLDDLATDYHVSYHTLRVQLKSAMRKCGVHSQVALVKKVLQDPRLMFFGEASTE